MSQEKRERQGQRLESEKKIWSFTKRDWDRSFRNHFIGSGSIKRLLIPLALLMFVWLLQELGLLW